MARESVALALAVVLATAQLVRATSQTTFATKVSATSYSINWVNDNLKSLLTFDGIGAISGGGATSRLLVEYPEDVASEIYDFLFLPNFGASLQIIKVEIGGEAQSTDGSEQSHMRSPGDLDFTRGYEWKILQEAKKRNPDIKTYGLPWAFPGWIGNSDKNDPFTNPERTANYTAQWVRGARDVHGIYIDYIGIWNERGDNKQYTLALRRLLDEMGFTKTLIVSNDGNANKICPKLGEDKEYADAVDIVGLHYPNDLDKNIAQSCAPLGKIIWSAEESSSYDDLNGAACWARVIASHYILNNMTSNIMWNLVGSYMHGTNWYASSILTAVQPWSGFYESGEMPVVWSTAHYTQFSAPGWKILPVGHGSGELAKGGYYVTLVSPDGQDFSIIIVKISQDHASCTRPRLWNFDTSPETARIILGDSLRKLIESKPLYGRYSNFESTDIPAPIFEPYQVSIENDGVLTIDIQVGAVYTISTISSSHKGKAKTQDSRDNVPSFPIPFYDDFTKYNCSGCLPHFLSDQMGIFEIHSKPSVLRQVTPEAPIHWAEFPLGPLSVIGMTEWEDVNITSRFRIPLEASKLAAQKKVAPAACLATRTNQYWNTGVVFCASTEKWVIRYGGPPRDTVVSAHDDNVITSGSIHIESDEWQRMSITVVGDVLKAASINDVQLIQQDLKLRSRDNGFAGLAVNGYFPIEFADLSIQPAGPKWQTRPETTRFTAGMRLGVRECTPNGIFDSAQAFELRANWQIRHVESIEGLENDDMRRNSLCAEAAHDGSLYLQACDIKSEQEFRNDYTTIRNQEAALHNKAGDLQGVPNGNAFVGNPVLPNEATFKRWAYFPNTLQLRSQLHYNSAVGSPQCLTVLGDTTASLKSISRDAIKMAVA